MHAANITYSLWRRRVWRDEGKAHMCVLQTRQVIMRVFMRCRGVSDICVTYSWKPWWNLCYLPFQSYRWQKKNAEARVGRMIMKIWRKEAAKDGNGDTVGKERWGRGGEGRRDVLNCGRPIRAKTSKSWEKSSGTQKGDGMQEVGKTETKVKVTREIEESISINLYITIPPDTYATVPYTLHTKWFTPQLEFTIYTDSRGNSIRYSCRAQRGKEGKWGTATCNLVWKWRTVNSESQVVSVFCLFVYSL